MFKLNLAWLAGAVFLLGMPLSHAQNYQLICERRECLSDKNEKLFKLWQPILTTKAHRIHEWFKALDFGLPVIVQDTKNNNLIEFYDSTKFLYNENCGTKGALACYVPDEKRLSIDLIYLKDLSDKNKYEAFDTLAHELFHAVQTGSDTSEKNEWILEGPAAAVGHAYRLHQTGSGVYTRDPKYWDAPFNFVKANQSYGTSDFYIWLGKRMKSKDSVAYLSNFRHLKSPNGFQEFDRMLKASGAGNFGSLYPYFIADKTNTLYEFYAVIRKLRPNDLQTFATTGLQRRLTTDVNFNGADKSEHTFDFKVLESSARPDFLIANYANPPTDDRERLRIVTANVKKADRRQDLYLAHETEYIPQYEDLRLIVPAMPEVKLGLMRTTNVTEKIADAKPQSGEMILKDDKLRLHVPSCVDGGAQIQLAFKTDKLIYPYQKFANHQSIIVHASMGEVDKQGVWTTPKTAAEVSFDIEIRDFINSDRKHPEGKTPTVWLRNIQQTIVGKKCDAQIRLQSGEKLTYDQEYDVTEFESNTDVILLKDPFIYAYSPGEGWCSFNLDFFSNMILNRTAGMLKKNRPNIVNILRKASRELSKTHPIEAKKINEAADDVNKIKVTTSAKGNPQLNLSKDVEIRSTSEIKQQFDFFRIPNALNDMLSLNRLRQIQRLRDEHSISAGGEIPEILIDLAPCDRYANRMCDHALFGEAQGHNKLDILYNHNDLISRIKADGSTMYFDYGDFKTRQAPVNARSCMSN